MDKDIDLDVDLSCDLSQSYRGDARGVLAAAVVAFVIQVYFFYYLSFRFYLSTHHALRQVLDDGETTWLELILDEEDEEERKKVDKAIDRLPKPVSDSVKKSKVLEKRCPVALAEKRKRNARLHLVAPELAALDAFNDGATTAVALGGANKVHPGDLDPAAAAAAPPEPPA